MAKPNNNRGFKLVGHRGAMGLAPENTVTAINKALEYGVDEVEFDLRTTKDKFVILCHNRKLIDNAGNALLVEASSFSELKKHKPDLALFSEVAETVNKQAVMVIEVKSGADIGAVVNAITELLSNGWPTDKLVVVSFNYKMLKAIHGAVPNLPLGVNEQWSGVRARHRADRLGTKRLGMQRRWLWRGYVGPLKKRNYHIYAYTVNDPKKAKKMVAYGLYGIITDYPDRY